MINLKQFTTRCLLKMKSDAYRFDNHYDKPSQAIPIEEIKAELGTREHVPNKIEARKIRQERARKGSRKTHKKN